ncbi:hypothetical protein KEM54_004780 [Ascosphaera aggregata]|nr:hypothetical protein KEM54_004780 [Ascosphaera aggregata]
MKQCKPILAVGAAAPFLAEDTVIADYFHGVDGLGNVHNSHPHLNPSEAWEYAFHNPWVTAPATAEGATQGKSIEDFGKHHRLFTPSKDPAYKEILRILRDNEANTITIVALGPLTNLALAAREDPETFVKAKEIAIMGGAIDYPGNVTAVAEFNVFADPFSSAIVYAFTSPDPTSTFPPKYAELGFRAPQTAERISIKLFPLDVTTHHRLSRGLFNSKTTPLVARGSPLAEWLTPMLAHTLALMDNTSTVHKGDDKTSMSLHDPLTAWYAVTASHGAWKTSARSPMDIRVETLGQWAKGACVYDRRTRRMIDEESASEGIDKAKKAAKKGSDHGNWLKPGVGNRVHVIEKTPGADIFAEELLDRILA